MFLDVLKVETDIENVKRKAEPDENMERMEAGYTALFQPSGEDGMDTFFQVKDELENQGYSPTSEGVKYRLHDEETKNIDMGVQRMLQDYTMDAEVRAGFIGAIGDTTQRPESGLPTKLLRELVLADDDAAVTDEAEDMRLRMIGSMENVTAYREAQQAVLDQADLAGNQHIGTMAVDLAQMVIPFIEQANVSEALIKVGEGGESLTSFFALGEAKEEFFNAFKKMPLDQRLEATETFVRIAKEANKTGFITNQLLEQQMVDELLHGGAYSTSDKWVDNLISLFDLSILGKPISYLVRGAQAGAKATKATKAAKTGTAVMSPKDMVRTKVSPLSPIRIASESNAQRTKALFHGVVVDETDDAAGAFGGSTKADVVGDSIEPEMAKASGVRHKINKVYDEADKTFIDDVEIQHDLAYSNVSAVTRKELESATANTIHQLQEVVGVTSRKEMFQHAVSPTGAKISAVYGPSVGGWGSVDDAVEMTEFALRDHGITRNEMYLMERSSATGEYVKVDSTTDGADFLIGVDYDYRLNFSDITQWENLSVKRNFLDRVPLAANFSFNRNIFDPASMLDPHIVLGANAAVDKAAKVSQDFLTVGKKFADKFGKAGTESQSQMYRYILDANENQIPHNINTLHGEYGFSPSEIETITAFREYWDTVWQARNLTEVRGLRNKGFKAFENVKNQDRMYVKPINKMEANKNEKFYDPSTDEAKSMSSAELNKLYEQGGTVARLRRVQEFGESVTNQIIVRNGEDIRGLRDSDTPYPYREGYFQRTYTSPHFIIKKGTTDGGKEFERAVATAEAETDAKIYINRLKATDAEGEYYVRGNLKDPRAQAEYEMDTYESTGLSSMRSRGEKLEDATAAVRGTEDNNVLGPVDAIISSSRAMGRNIAEREFIEAAKQRFMKQFEDILPKKFGKPVYPREMKDLGDAGDAVSSHVADARSTYEYISYLEFGYINGMDSIYKGVVKGLGRMAGDIKWRGAEVGLGKAGDVNPSSLLKNLSFQMYLATNPLRQFSLNAHQSTLLTSTFSKYVLSQKLAADMHAFMYLRMGQKIPKFAVKATGRSQGEINLMWKEFERSGLTAGIDQQNMMRGALLDYAEANRFKGEASPLNKGLNLTRKIGFDLGEEINLTSSWLAHYDRATGAKGTLNATDFNTISGQARNFTFNMNRAGDMAYNANSLSLMFQYFQVPHKSLLVATNRAMSRSDRARLVGYNAMMFTLPPAAMLGMFGAILPDAEKYPEAHDAILTGLQFHAFNKLIEGVSGEQSRIDFGNLAPSDAYGIYDMLHSMMTTELGGMIAATPSGQLFFGGNPRITNLARSASRILWKDPNVEENPVTLHQVYHDLASLSSGYSNQYKSRQALRYHKVYGARGQVLDASVSTPEAIAMAFGFKTLDTTMATAVSMDMWKDSSDYTKDVNKWYKDFTRRLAVEGISSEEEAYVIKTMAQGFSVFEGSEKALSIVQKNLARDTANGSAVIYDAVLRQADYTSVDQLKVWAENTPDDGTGSKQDLLDTIKYISEFEYEDNK